jgi:hypothetical protein
MYYSGKMMYYTGKMPLDTTVYTHIHTGTRKNENTMEKCFITAEKWFAPIEKMLYNTGKMIDVKEKCFSI